MVENIQKPHIAARKGEMKHNFAAIPIAEDAEDGVKSEHHIEKMGSLYNLQDKIVKNQRIADCRSLIIHPFLEMILYMGQIFYNTPETKFNTDTNLSVTHFDDLSLEAKRNIDHFLQEMKKDAGKKRLKINDKENPLQINRYSAIQHYVFNFRENTLNLHYYFLTREIVITAQAMRSGCTQIVIPYADLSEKGKAFFDHVQQTWQKGLRAANVKPIGINPR